MLIFGVCFQIVGQTGSERFVTNAPKSIIALVAMSVTGLGALISKIEAIPPAISPKI